MNLSSPYCCQLIFIFLIIQQACSAADGTLSWIQRDEGVTVVDGIRPVLTFQAATKSQTGKWPRANYVHPLYDLNGEVLTEDFPNDHGHHRGIFWAWHQVKVAGKQVGDAWLCHNFEWQVKNVSVKYRDKAAEINADVTWLSPEFVSPDGAMEAIATEKVRIVVHPISSAGRKIDFHLQFLAMQRNVKIGGSDDEKGYGGFSPRIKLSTDTRFLSREGIVAPVKLAVSAGPWLDISNSKYGLCIFSHPTNPKPLPGLDTDTQSWILRQARSMQNAVYPGRQPVALSDTAPLELSYRLLVHDGEREVSEFEKLYTEFAASPR